MERQIRIAPSILSADFAYLGAAVAEAEAAGADMIHVDVMDGHFVPNLTIGPVVVKALRRVTRLPLDVHLMIAQPERYISAFAEAGADTLLIHPEASIHLHRTLQQIRGLDVAAGVVLNPATAEEALRYVLPLVDRVLIMSVNPGFGGQAFLPEVLPKIARVRALLDVADNPALLAVDGGINETTAPQVVEAGADTLIAGSAIFGASVGVAAALQALREAAQRTG
ncbi:MAG TPA: ribulose-phosphate 3-epimerase [Chloroflexi bacterium]|nr:ribulose-phosphate 3-epimerase [Chloroflexota bacterium]